MVTCKHSILYMCRMVGQAVPHDHAVGGQTLFSSLPVEQCVISSPDMVAWRLPGRLQVVDRHTRLPSHPRRLSLLCSLFSFYRLMPYPNMCRHVCVMTTLNISNTVERRNLAVPSWFSLSLLGWDMGHLPPSISGDGQAGGVVGGALTNIPPSLLPLPHATPTQAGLVSVFVLLLTFPDPAPSLPHHLHFVLWFCSIPATSTAQALPVLPTDIPAKDSMCCALLLRRSACWHGCSSIWYREAFAGVTCVWTLTNMVILLTLLQTFL